MNTGRHHDEFDRAMRALHGEAVARVSLPVRRRLRAARDRAGADAPASRFGWPVAGALAAALVLAIALPSRLPAPDTPAPTGIAGADRSGPTPSTAAGPGGGAADASVPTALAALEESPDFYLWLASNDAGPAGALP